MKLHDKAISIHNNNNDRSKAIFTFILSKHMQNFQKPIHLKLPIPAQPKNNNNQKNPPGSLHDSPPPKEKT